MVSISMGRSSSAGFAGRPEDDDAALLAGNGGSAKSGANAMKPAMTNAWPTSATTIAIAARDAHLFRREAMLDLTSIL
jgi:hypothetical protein